MREFKLRSWNKYRKEFIYFARGAYFTISSGRNYKVSSNLFTWNNAEQYVRLKDENGKEYFSGDIAILKGACINIEKPLVDIIAEVRYIDGCFTFYNSRGCFEPVRMKPKSWEIIGNIHENKELLK